MKCGHINLYGALYCDKCWTLLSKIDLDPLRVTTPMDESSLNVPVAATNRHQVNRTALLEMAGARSITFYVDGLSESVVVSLDSQVTLGRATLLDTQALIDLSPFGAIDKGVSRQHCTLKWSNSGVMVQDLGSRNGTWLDGVRLQPNVPTLVTSGCRLRLSRLELDVYLPE